MPDEMPTPTPATSTQTDRIMAVALAAAYLAGLVYFLGDDNVPDRIVAYYTGAGVLVILPTVIFLLSRVFAFKGISDTLDKIVASTAKIEDNTNGNLTARLNQQTEDIIERIATEVAADLRPAGKRVDNG